MGWLALPAAARTALGATAGPAATPLTAMLCVAGSLKSLPGQAGWRRGELPCCRARGNDERMSSVT